MACTTVTAVTTDWPPSGKVVVCRITAVVDSGLAVVVSLPLPPADVVAAVDDAASPDPETVMTPPSTVLSIVTPAALVVVTTAPDVRVKAPPLPVVITGIPAALVPVVTTPEDKDPALDTETGPGPKWSEEGELAGKVLVTKSVVGVALLT